MHQQQQHRKQHEGQIRRNILWIKQTTPPTVTEAM
jgi:hypothetical protein